MDTLLGLAHVYNESAYWLTRTVVKPVCGLFSYSSRYNKPNIKPKTRWRAIFCINDFQLASLGNSPFLIRGWYLSARGVNHQAPTIKISPKIAPFNQLGPGRKRLSTAA